MRILVRRKSSATSMLCLPPIINDAFPMDDVAGLTAGATRD
jgi:hypothetical protein